MLPDQRPDPREARLPAWARELIKRERRLRQDAQRVAEDAALATRPEASGAILDRFADLPIGPGEHPQVSFRTDFPGFPPGMGFIDVRTTDRGLYVNAVGEIVVRQSSINALHIVPWPGPA